MSTYLDCCASTPLDSTVREVILSHLVPEFGNSGSLHSYGERARYAVRRAQCQVATLLAVEPEQVVFTSGATESNNLALTAARARVVTTAIEHPSVQVPLEMRGLHTSILAPNRGGWVSPEALAKALVPDTDFVSVMHANNETGVLQPIAALAEMLDGHSAIFHVDAAQSVAWRAEELQHPGIDLITLSGHKMYGPQGVGALVVKSDRAWERLQPQIRGGGQQQGLRSGTLPVALVAGLGQAAEMAHKMRDSREAECQRYRQEVLREAVSLGGCVIGCQERALSHVALLMFPGLDAYAAVRSLKGVAAVSAGSACASGGQEPSRVILAMGYDVVEASSVLRLSWCAQTPRLDWGAFTECLEKIGFHRPLRLI